MGLVFARSMLKPDEVDRIRGYAQTYGTPLAAQATRLTQHANEYLIRSVSKIHRQ